MTDSHSLPLYIQLSELLIREIQSGRLADGERLAPEREMAAQLGTSVGTLRKALADLTGKGLLERVQGSGNYVRAKVDAKSVYAFFRVELLDGGGLPTAALLDVARVVKAPGLPEFGNSPEGHRIRRLRSLNRQPAVLEEIWLDGDYTPRIDPEVLSESLYLFYREALGLWITRIEDRATMDVVPDWAPISFGVMPGAPCLRIQRISWAQDGTRAEVSNNWIDSTVATYVTRLT
ncbi:GntR family transcriptional regulator [Puniceibacterium sp. IMCC21224]|uniref:GntR family transcriptional regulator n=1 Tax=Puniceibacterium sp. IMCC21224 TaxID=1618204 RepID=UPI00064DAF83|nr:GntR family transcriptional regulator [Puniceibacterium sp. IMCC21224]KMK66736.1 transcriptional regulator [Puniceibacterium sp. IMCC21224]